jgi:hypothetical protein
MFSPSENSSGFVASMSIEETNKLRAKLGLKPLNVGSGQDASSKQVLRPPFLGQRHVVPLLLLGPPLFPIILFLSTTLLTGMTGISLHLQWPLTSQSHGSTQENFPKSKFADVELP